MSKQSFENWFNDIAEIAAKKAGNGNVPIKPVSQQPSTSTSLMTGKQLEKLICQQGDMGIPKSDLMYLAMRMISISMIWSLQDEGEEYWRDVYSKLDKKRVNLMAQKK